MGHLKITPQSKNLPDGAKQITLLIEGDIDASNATFLNEQLTLATNKNPTHLQFDLTGVTSVGAAGIVFFHTALQIQQRRGGTCSLINTKPKNETVQFQSTEIASHTTLITIAGNLDMQASKSIEDRFFGLCRGDRQFLIIDLSALDFISSMGIRLLLQGLKQVTSTHGRMLFLNPSAQVVSSLEIAGFTPFLAHGSAEDVAANMR